MTHKTLIVALVFIVTLGFFASSANVVHAAPDASNFDPGRIIDDAIFYDPDGMGSVNDIQAFLNAHVPSCDTWGTRASGYQNLTNAQYAQQVKGWPGPPYICLNNYYENPTTGETSYEKGGGAFEGGLSTAQIIYNASQQYRINPKVLLVMLRKESLNLFSDSWPLKSQYKYAMGYACPDSGPNYSANCQSNKSGFYKQMTYAAWQLRYYYDNMSTYNYQPGRWNTIQYSTNPACGTKDVYIQNYATASLYIYTPYTPNDAALNAYPGEAPCGAYGNRNFWFFWQEWFGSTSTNGNFVRTVDNATVYLVGDKMKYPVADVAILGSLSALGGVGFVSQTYLNSIPTGSVMGRVIQGTDGTIYFYDSNIKLAFSSCELVTAYGSSCGQAAELTQAQINKLVNGPLVTKGMKTTSGRTYYVNGGQKREVLDSTSLANEGISVGFNTLTDSSLNHLPLGVPVIRDDAIIQSRQDGSTRLIKNGSSYFKIDPLVIANSAFKNLPVGQIDSQSIATLNASPTTLSDYFKDTVSSYVLTQDGKKRVQDPSSLGNANTQVPVSLSNKLIGSGDLSNPSLLKSYTDGTVYVMVNGQKRPLIAMEDLKSITGESTPYIGWLGGNYLSTTPTGNIIVGAGRLVKTPSSATVYMTDGYDKLVPMSSFDPAYDLGLNMLIRVVSETILSKYSISQSILSSNVSCLDQNYVGMGGNIYSSTINSSQKSVLQPQTCNVLLKVVATPEFLNGPDGTIYQLNSQTLRPIKSWQTYTSLNTTNKPLIKVTNATLRLYSIGSVL